MKKTVFVTFVILALLVSMLPISAALAKSPGSAAITVRNQTGGKVTLVLLNSANSRHEFTFSGSATKISMPVGFYSYVAETICGTKSGVVNMTRAAVLHFSCVKGEQVKIARPK